MAYVYRHIRVDKNIPFYIGIGKDINYEYKRAYSKHNRNKYWHNITNSIPYEVEIIIDGISWQEACLKETEFIDLYGRKDLNAGILINMSNGGEGVSGWSQESLNKLRESKKNIIVSEETKRKLSESHKGYKPTMQAIENMKKARVGKTITRETREKMAAKLRGRKLPDWVKEKFSNAHLGKEATWCHKPLYQFSINGELMSEYKSITHASKALNIQTSNIVKCLKGKRLHCGGFLFQYKTGDFEKNVLTDKK